MKFRKAFLFLIAATGMLFSLESCNKCKDSGVVTFDGATQYLSITYLDTAGRNYMDSIYNKFNVSVLINTNGGFGAYQPFAEDKNDGKIGPFQYTMEPEPAALGVPYDYWFIVNKDTFGVDTFQVKFLAAVDECKEYWAQIEYYRNGDMIAQCDLQEICELTFTE